MTRSRYRFGEQEYPYFITNTIVAWLPIFAQPKLADIIFDSWRFLMREREVPHLRLRRHGESPALDSGERKPERTRRSIQVIHRSKDY